MATSSSGSASRSFRCTGTRIRIRTPTTGMRTAIRTRPGTIRRTATGDTAAIT